MPGIKVIDPRPNSTLQAPQRPALKWHRYGGPLLAALLLATWGSSDWLTPNTAAAQVISPASIPAASSAEPSSTAPAASAAIAPASPRASSNSIIEITPASDPASAPIARHLPGNPSPNSYAFREDARQLANDIAQTMQLEPDWVWAALSQAQVKDTVTKLIMPPPQGMAKNWAVYRSRFVEPIRIRAGTAFWRAHAADLQRAEDTYGVPAEVIAGILGVETIYGRQTGNFRVLDVLATLSLDFPRGRSDRSAFFKDELAQFFKLCQEQGVDPTSMLGSFAGAIGLPQFMPSSIRRYAVDFDGDGHIDLRNSAVDAIGSVAHYLAEHGWKRDWPAYFNITVPTDRLAMDKLLTPDILPTFSASDMAALGVGLPKTGQSHTGLLALVQLENGGRAPTLIAGTSNFYAVTRYNQSSYYALAVIQLGQALSHEMTQNQSHTH